MLELARRGRFELCLSPFILAEVAGVLERQFGWSRDRTSQALQALEDAATVVQPLSTITVIDGNRPDNRILECAAEISADHLITGDRQHLLPHGEYKGVEILRAPRFLSMLEMR